MIINLMIIKDCVLTWECVPLEVELRYQGQQKVALGCRELHLFYIV